MIRVYTYQLDSQKVKKKNDMKSVAKKYIDAGLCALPAIKKQKRPTVSWKKYQHELPKAVELDFLFPRTTDGICLVCGEVSGNLELLDFDQAGKMFPAWKEKIPADLAARLVVESSQSGGLHIVYRCAEKIPGNLKLAGDESGVLIETRGEGGLFLCSPTPGYEMQQGDLTAIPTITGAERALLIDTAREFDTQAEPKLTKNKTTETPAKRSQIVEQEGRPGDAYNRSGDVRDVLTRTGWTFVFKDDKNEHWRRPGKTKGESATLRLADNVFHVFTSSTVFEASTAYSSHAVYTELAHGGDWSASTAELANLGYGEKKSKKFVDEFPDIDISGLLDNCTKKDRWGPVDPGHIPERLYDVPGLIKQIMDFSLANAPYPNKALSFCGAISMMSYLCGRRIRTEGDLRPNIYMVALAGSGSGKDFPRKVNSQIMHKTGQLPHLGDKFASGEGLQDALAARNQMFFQCDEMDSVFASINSDREFSGESISSTLMTMYTSSADFFPMRVKAGQQVAQTIDQPHLTLFGTATPRFFYESLSPRMLTNGLFSRMMIVDIGKRGKGQKPGSAKDLPEEIIKLAQYWVNHHTATGAMGAISPTPDIYDFSPEADQAVIDLRNFADAEYDIADDKNDEIAKTVWSRVCANAIKLALIYSASEDVSSVTIGLQAVAWATEFATHQARRQLYMAAQHVSEGPFHADCQRVLRRIGREKKNTIPHSTLLRSVHISALELAKITRTLEEREEIKTTFVPGGAKIYTII